MIFGVLALLQTCFCCVWVWNIFGNGMLSKIVEHLLMLAFGKPNHLSNTERHQCHMFQINFVHSPEVLLILWCILDMRVVNVKNKSCRFQINFQHLSSNYIYTCNSTLSCSNNTVIHYCLECRWHQHKVKGERYKGRLIPNGGLILATVQESFLVHSFVEWPTSVLFVCARSVLMIECMYDTVASASSHHVLLRVLDHRWSEQMVCVSQMVSEQGVSYFSDHQWSELPQAQGVSSERGCDWPLHHHWGLWHPCWLRGGTNQNSAA